MQDAKNDLTLTAVNLSKPEYSRIANVGVRHDVDEYDSEDGSNWVYDQNNKKRPGSDIDNDDKVIFVVQSFLLFLITL